MGPVEARDGDGVVDLGRPQQRLVLAVLLVEAGRLVPTDALIDRVWDEAPGAARRTVQVHIARLRRLLAECDDRTGVPIPLVRRSGGYLLDINPEWVDVHRFRYLVGRARGEGHGGTERVAWLREAIGLWRGDPLSGLSGQWVASTRTAWQEEYIDAVALWAQAERQAGNPSVVIGPLTELAGRHPFTETLTIELMRAMHDAGRTADALDAYGRTRKILAEELGIDPGQQLQHVYGCILRGESQTRPVQPLSQTDNDDFVRRPSSRRAWHAPVAVAAAVVLLAGTAALLTGEREPDASRAGLATPIAINPTTATVFAATADMIMPSEADAQPGPYSYVEIEHWRRDDAHIGVLHERIWRHSGDGSGRNSVRRLPVQPARGFDRNTIGTTRFDHVPPMDTPVPADWQSFTEQHGAAPSADPHELIRQLNAARVKADSPATCPVPDQYTMPGNVLVNNLLDLHREEYLGRAVRAAVLRIVAMLPGARYGGFENDPKGRLGIAMALEVNGARLKLIFDPIHGYLLAAQCEIPDIALDDYTLYMRHGRTERLE